MQAKPFGATPSLRQIRINEYKLSVADLLGNVSNALLRHMLFNCLTRICSYHF